MLPTMTRGSPPGSASSAPSRSSASSARSSCSDPTAIRDIGLTGPVGRSTSLGTTQTGQDVFAQLA